MNDIQEVLPKTADEVQQTVAENTAFRSRTKLSRYDRRDMALGLCTRAFDKARAGVPLDKAIFGLTAREKAYVSALVAEYQEWEKNPVAYTTALDQPTKPAEA